MVAVVLQGAGTGQHLVRPWLGARVESVSADLARRVGLAKPTGAVVSFLSPGGPAERAGLRLGDVILAMDGRDVPDREALRYRVATRGLNETVALQVHRRSGETLAMQVTLVNPPEDPPRNARKIEGTSPLAGATIANLSPALAEELGTPGIPEFGVIILAVDPGSTAEKVKLSQGDVIAKINGEDMGTVERVVRAAAEPRDNWRLGIRRQNKMLDMSATKP
jgi:serine protease Do